MKQFFISTLLAVATLTVQADDKTVIDQREGSITFVVDEHLAPVEHAHRYLCNGNTLAQLLLAEHGVRMDDCHILASSFADEQAMLFAGKDAFHACMVNAYANHLPVTLSPDMIWLLISQGFARYVHAHAEALRPLLVEHGSTATLAVRTGKDLLVEADWPALMDSFAAQIDRHTKDGVAPLIAADFSTTGPTERMASLITLMESVKAYFEYRVVRIACGIPSITLQGTPADWQRVIDKTRRLEAYGLKAWTKQLVPILTEFLHAAEGQPRQKFWQNMIKKQRVGQLKGGGCAPDKPTELDGWLLKFFPNEDGRTPSSIPHTKRMSPECVCTGFIYSVIDPVTGIVISETPMELWAGFVGVKVEPSTGALMPAIGWMVRVADNEAASTDDDHSGSENWLPIETSK